MTELGLDIGLGTCAGNTCVPTIEASINKVNGQQVTTALGCSDRKCAVADIKAATNIVAGSDVVILALGIDGTIEGEGHDRMEIGLPGKQEDLALAVIAEAQKHSIPVAVLMFNGGLVAIESLKAQPVAIMQCFYPGATGYMVVAA